ncbi:MAG: DUF2891 domain-containing protein [Bacteroidota bacterium]
MSVRRRASLLASCVAMLCIVVCSGEAQRNTKARSGDPWAKLHLTREAASNFAPLALNCIRKEYPNKPEHVLNTEKDVQSPRALHPAFYGCFDWHSAVHAHWMLVRLLRLFPDLPQAGEIRSAMSQNLSAQNIKIEVQYLDQPGRKSFERTYGWGWLLKLAEELHTWKDPDGQIWGRNLAPLIQAIVERYKDFLPRQTYPIRTGVHPNTAFGITFALDYARTVGDRELERLLVDRARAYYQDDKDCPSGWEPGGEDFFSPCLMEADLMRRVLTPQKFNEWLRSFLSSFADGRPNNMLQPAIVSDRSDPKIVHLDGLNLTRAWCMLGIASSLPASDPLRAVLTNSALRHAETALAHVASGHYEGEHWLASFATYMFSHVELLKSR